MAAEMIGGSNATLTIPVSGTWSQYTIDNINITSGQCKVDFWDRASANGWVHIDDVVLQKK
jgi:arabinogalactan endo-1,4-beta-galactosidase